VDNPELGQILVTVDGMTLYTNTVDTPGDLKCINIACTGFWPPFTVEAQPTAEEGIPGSLGTITRPDGSTQITYNDQPLYTFYLDRAPGDASGNGFTDFGGTWHVVPPES
jgi:predicted lipoprotein with Yx(FWY)xxD motif